MCDSVRLLFFFFFFCKPTYELIFQLQYAL